MKPFIALFFSFFMFSVSYAQTATPLQTAKDADKFLLFTNADFDMGKIPSGKPIEYTVIIKNISKDTVVLEDVKVGCGCTTPKFRARESLLPGKSTFISLGFNGGASGEFTKTADIFFSGGLTKQVKFHGNAYVDSSGAKLPPSIANN